jgi:hypothetical protein
MLISHEILLREVDARRSHCLALRMRCENISTPLDSSPYLTSVGTRDAISPTHG